MQSWLLEVKRGRRALVKHSPIEAIHHFEKALLTIPTERRVPSRSAQTNRLALARLFYLLGVSFRKAGMRNRAVGNWVQSAKLLKRGHVRRRLLRITNEYGMARQARPEIDDQHAFYGIQLSRYIRSKRSHRLGTRAEVDMVIELVEEYWELLKSSYDLSGMEPDEKVRLFNETIVVFPFLSVPEALESNDIAVDFCHGRRIGNDDRCVCGSGLPYRMCCGRISGIDEALAGKF